jgi:hypothetical protein
MAFKKEYIPWNKGLTKETDKRVRGYSKKLKGKHNSIKTEFKKGRNLGVIEKELYGIKRAKEIRGKLNKTRKENGWFKNSKKIREKLSKINKGLHHSPKTEFKKENIPHNKGKTKKDYEPLKQTSILIFILSTCVRDNFRPVIFMLENWKNEDYAKKMVRGQLKGLIKRPTSYEKMISDLCIENNLSFIYVGDGTFLIGHKNPDFINKNERIVIEVYNDYFKIRDFGSCEGYEKQRREYFAKYGYKTVFINKAIMTSKNWKKLCLNKIILKGGKNG